MRSQASGTGWCGNLGKEADTMRAHADKISKNALPDVAQAVSRQRDTAASAVPAVLSDNRQAQQLKSNQHLLDHGPQLAQLASRQLASQAKPNRTGLPDRLKSGIEQLSGLSMDGVRVHYNSSRPAQLQAHAYAQGSDIHLAPGQEQHLPHEAWHVVQQAQGRVRPTLQMKGNVLVNDDAGLEAEADVMGSQAMQGKFTARMAAFNNSSASRRPVAQRQLRIGNTADLLPADQVKLADLLRIADAAHGADADATLAGKDVTVEITAPGKTEISPAQTWTTGNMITVEIQRAYFELASLGELLGMIAHEVGVHAYGNLLQQLPAAGGPWQPVPSTRPKRAASGYEMGTKNRHVSEDHLDVTQQLAGNPVAGRANKYVETILHHGDAIENDGFLTPAEKVEAQGELVSSYCFDIARIVATDDRMAYVPAHWDAIREVYALAYTSLQNSAVGNAAWFAAAPLKPAAQLKPDFNSMAWRFVWKKLKGR